MNFVIRVLLVTVCATPLVSAAETPNFQWGVKIPMRDGVKLNATVYTPAKKEPAPCARPVTVTLYHDGQHQSTLYVPLGTKG